MKEWLNFGDDELSFPRFTLLFIYIVVMIFLNDFKSIFIHWFLLRILFQFSTRKKYFHARSLILLFKKSLNLFRNLGGLVVFGKKKKRERQFVLFVSQIRITKCLRPT